MTISFKGLKGTATARLLIKISHLSLEIWQEEFTPGDPVSKAVNPGILQQFNVRLLPAIVLSACSLTFDPSPLLSGSPRRVHHVIIKRYWTETGQKPSFLVGCLSFWEGGEESCVSGQGNPSKSHRPTGTTRRGNPPKTSCQEERGLLTISLSPSLGRQTSSLKATFILCYMFFTITQ